jgi:ariadne-1
MRWNKDRLIDKYMDNASAISAAAGITPPSAPSSPGPERSQRRTTAARTTRSSKKATPPPPSTPAPAAEPFVCPICFDDTQQQTRALSCGHAFCEPCWAAYACGKIRDEGEHRIACMAEGCALTAPDPFVSECVSGDTRATVRFRGLLVRDYVEGHRDLKFCPYPECSHTIRCGQGSSRTALSTIVPTVVCGADPRHAFCFGCPIEGDHRPLVCPVSKMWLQKCHDDSETANWIKSNTKECSKCQSTIEKNGGCKCVSIFTLLLLLFSFSVCFVYSRELTWCAAT